MSKSRWRLIIFLWLFGLLLIFCRERSLLSQRDTRVVVCDVGQGDAILIIDGDHQILVDGGPDAAVLRCLREEIPRVDKELELVILTHADADHFTGLIDVFQAYSVQRLLINNQYKESPEFAQFYNLLKNQQQTQQLKIEVPTSAQKWCETKKLCLEILWWSSESLPGNIFSYNFQISELSDMLKNFDQTNIDYNDGSIVINLIIDHKNILLTGDISEASELALLKSGLLKKIDVLKIAHHGSKSSSSSQFLALVQPEISLISVGQGNSFKHPTSAVLTRLAEINSQIWRTDLMGKITLIFRSGQLEVKSEKIAQNWLSW
ncbi:MAG: MBL fold metallo-hydrolase [bacterium]|nr:MBL fold metallo-hydrolase [bacterium]